MSLHFPFVHGTDLSLKTMSSHWLASVLMKRRGKLCQWASAHRGASQRKICVQNLITNPMISSLGSPIRLLSSSFPFWSNQLAYSTHFLRLKICVHFFSLNHSMESTIDYCAFVQKLRLDSPYMLTVPHGKRERLKQPDTERTQWLAFTEAHCSEICYKVFKEDNQTSSVCELWPRFHRHLLSIKSYWCNSLLVGFSSLHFSG